MTRELLPTDVRAGQRGHDDLHNDVNQTVNDLGQEMDTLTDQIVDVNDQVDQLNQRVDEDIENAVRDVAPSVIDELVDDSAVAAVTAQLAADPGYDVVLLIGQSNMSGRGAIDTHLDVRPDRVFQYGSTGADTGRGSVISIADEPLQQADRTALGNTLGPGGVFASWYVAGLRPSRRVLLVPAAFGGTGFSSGSPNTWAAGAGSLRARAIAQANAAVAAAGPGSRLAAILWVQGEQDSYDPGASAGDYSFTQYATAIDSLIDDLRAGIVTATPTTPFLIGRMAPRFILRGGWKVDGAQVDTPRRKPAVIVADGPSGTNYETGDRTHYNAAGVRALGRSFYDALLKPGQIVAFPSDSFDRAVDLAGIGLTPGGARWRQWLGTWGVDGNGAAVLTRPADDASYPWNTVGLVTTSSDNITITWTLAYPGSLGISGYASDFGVVFRQVNARNYYLLRREGDSQLGLYKSTDTSATLLKSWTGVGFTTGSDTLAVKLVGDSITPIVNGTALTPYTDAGGLRGTSHGLWCSGSSNVLGKGGWLDISVTANPAPTTFSDSFDRADNPNSLGSGWTALTGTWGIISNAAYMPAATNNGPAPFNAVVHEMGTGDVSVEVPFAGPNIDIADLGIAFRVQDANNYWLARLGGGTVQLFKISNSAVSQVGSDFPAPHSSTSATLKVVLNGSSINLRVNGTSITTVNDSFLATATRHGLAGVTTGQTRASSIAITV